MLLPKSNPQVKWKSAHEEEFKKIFNATWLFGIAVASALIGIVGKRLWELGGKHRTLARYLFRKMFQASVATGEPVLAGYSPPVLAFRAVWYEGFPVSAQERLDGWNWSALKRRVELVYYAPEVTAITPVRGRTGTMVTITGRWFTAAVGVRFGSGRGTGMAVASDTQVSVLSPRASGVASITVITPAGRASAPSAAAQFTYVAPLREP